MKTAKKAEKFPLWLHPRGQWCKKLNGRFYYFGTDKEAARERYDREWDDIVAGRRPHEPIDSITVADLVNAFLTAKEMKVESGDLSRAMLGEYVAAGKRIAEVFGHNRSVVDLRPDDFGRLRAAAARKLGPTALTKFITMTKSIFAYGYSSERIEKPVRYGDQFERPAKRTMRLLRQSKPKKLLSAADVRSLIGAANGQLRAMLLLMVNAAYGAKDCSDLQRKSVDLVGGWLDAPRQKTGIHRRCKLWPETVEALKAVYPIRPESRDPADAGCVFLTTHGNRWVRYREKSVPGRGVNLDAVNLEYKKLCKRLSILSPGGPYVLRHVARTVADEVNDLPAIDLIMGHGDASMADRYREKISDARIELVTDHIRAWLFPSSSGQEQEAKKRMSDS
jgi:integrase